MAEWIAGDKSLPESVHAELGDLLEPGEELLCGFLPDLNASLQYVEAQDQLLLAFTRYRPRFIVLPRFMGRDGDGYVTRQLVQGFETPCQVSSIAAITDTLASQRYQPALTIRDGFDLSPMFDDDVPEQLRTGQEWLLVFREAS